jgi:hypothetical protein
MKKTLYVILTILIILIVTNPTVQDLKDYLGKTDNMNIKREKNYFIFSTYSVDVFRFNGEHIFFDEMEGTDIYYGYLGNFKLNYEFDDIFKSESRIKFENNRDKAIADSIASAQADSISNAASMAADSASNGY